ncbi:MAG TPA: hypothetical protein VGL77_08055, partial [Armatimonadota bacterium]
MPIIDEVGRKSWHIRVVTALMYVVLAVLGVAMVYPFLITLTASTSNAMDYRRFAPISRAIWSHEERFVRGMVPLFPSKMRGNMEQLTLLFNAVPPKWSN